MTALPPTTGHLQLIQFASSLADTCTIMLTTQPDEPFVQERVDALYQAIERLPYRPSIVHYSRPMDPDPESPGFRDRWAGIMIGAGAEPGDLLVISEEWGRWLAEMTQMDWRPYDIRREINTAKGTLIREDPHLYWYDIIPEFRRHLQVRVTIFGAESTGKTTLAKAIANRMGALCLPEYARPYLETVGNEINWASMQAIYEGQRALQQADWYEDPLVIQDTDLFSTFGYWWNMRERIGENPNPRSTEGWGIKDDWPAEGLMEDAQALASDLYIVLPSAIPFEPDPLRYGGDHREIEDPYWIKLVSGQNLNYVVLPEHETDAWVDGVQALIEEAMTNKAKLISYDRHGY